MGPATALARSALSPSSNEESVSCPVSGVNRKLQRPVRAHFPNRPYTLGLGGGSSRATTVSEKASRWWAPSQNGLLAEWPQRHKEIAVLPARPKEAPLGSRISNSPSIRIGPLFWGVIFAGIPGSYHVPFGGADPWSARDAPSRGPYNHVGILHDGKAGEGAGCGPGRPLYCFLVGGAVVPFLSSTTPPNLIVDLPSYRL